MRTKLTHPKYKAVGGIGLEYYRRQSSHDRQLQQEVFGDLLRLALHYQKLVVIHCRNAFQDCFEICRDILPKNWKIHLQCFTEGSISAKRWCRHFYNTFIGVTPILLDQHHEKHQVVQYVATNISLRRLQV